MINNHLVNDENKKQQLLKLTVRILRQEAKKLSVPLYSRKNKTLLVDSILKYQKKALIEDQTNNSGELESFKKLLIFNWEENKIINFKAFETVVVDINSMSEWIDSI